MNSVDCVVVGAGAVGLAIGRAFARCGLETLIIEARRQIGTGESSRNSEVIHAGIYYPEGSLKARLCVTGRHALYDYCATHGIPHRRCGKLIVATNPAQVEGLQALQLLARAAGVQDLVMLSEAAARRLEPELSCVAALESPSTGILDSHAYMLALQGDAEAAGATVALDTVVTRFSLGTRSIELRLDEDTGATLRARVVVNCAGLGAQALAATLPELPANHLPPLHLAKGSYFSLSARAPFSRLIYPLPQTGGLGVHLTLDLHGRARFGPDVEWLNSPDYHVDPARATQFYGAIRQYWPGLPQGSLSPGYAGVRAKLSGPGEPVADFVISGPKEHGIPGLINLFGIESPGLTSSLAIGAHVVSLAMEHALPA